MLSVVAQRLFLKHANSKKPGAFCVKVVAKGQSGSRLVTQVGQFEELSQKLWVFMDLRWRVINLLDVRKSPADLDRRPNKGGMFSFRVILQCFNLS